MLEPLAILLLVMFAGAAVALQAFQVLHAFNNNASRPVPSTSARMLWQRYRTWAIIALLFASATLSGPLVIAVLCAFLCWQGGREYALLAEMPMVHRVALVLAGLITLLAVLLFGLTALLIAPVIAFFAWSLLALQPLKGEAESGKRFTFGVAGLWGYLYLGWLPAHLLALSMGKVPGLVLAVGLGVALSDVGAFCTGKLRGGPQLAPRLSPNKTWGGVLGNVLGAVLALVLTALALPGLQLWQRGVFALAIGLGSVWGDLLESLLKRQHGVKDAGELLPGFGGLLDRIDSLLLVAPLVYYLALLLIH